MKTLEKPIESTWTDEQWEAIAARGSNVLVAAAAGSGKTAVLVERIIRRIIDKHNPLSVDHLLVVTFTNAAAAEMRHRIGGALEKAVAADPSPYLRRQVTLLNRASITTLHSFCMEVLQRYYYLIDIDPSFRIADSTEAQLLRQEAMDELLEDEYEKEDNPFFFRLIDSYTGDRGDEALQHLLLKVYDFARSHPWPDYWLDEMASMYRVGTIEAFYGLPWFRYLRNDVQLELTGALELLRQGGEVAQMSGGPLPYLANFQEDEVLIKRLLEKCAGSWEELHEAFQTAAFGKLKPCKKKECDEALIEKAKKLRDRVKDTVANLQREMFAIPPQSYFELTREMSPLIDKLIELVRRFGERYSALKQAKGLVDFSDLEHYCLKVLCDEKAEPGLILPSAAALEYRAQFGEVLVDEYQDTNEVQETIVRLVTKDGDTEGNLFMVGDVKQSIYRFRLAEPGLFLHKYRTYTSDGAGGGKRIDLAKNFRSRREVIDGTNFIFKQIMTEAAGEIEYDDAAQLVLGAEDYPESEGVDSCVEVLLIDRNEGKPGEEEADTGADGMESEVTNPFTGEDTIPDASELETAQLEARLIASKIKQLVGATDRSPYLVYDKTSKTMRPVQYKDIVILLRSVSGWAQVMAEEFKWNGIPAYAELSGGYFAATEIEVMTSLLHIIDNPFQDIPLAAVLRSPLVQLSAEDMAQVRLAQKDKPYYESLLAYLEQNKENGSLLFKKLQRFRSQLESWRTEARQGALSTLIWHIYRETGYYDFVGGLPGGKQRQANLRALYDRACQYEATSFRGLFRFLRFIEKMQAQGGDLGTARTLGEQEDVVRIMTIHKSKGLEFPVVFVAGLAKQHNFQDLNGNFLLHKELGFGPKYVEPQQRVSFPMLSHAAMKRRMRLEQLAEEMRVLYVALTRAREKLFLVGTAKHLPNAIEKWARHISVSGWTLPDYELVKGRTYLDWIGPALLRHRDAEPLHAIIGGGERSLACVHDHDSRWSVASVPASSLVCTLEEEKQIQQEIELSIAEGRPVPIESSYREQVERQLSWSYVHYAATAHLSKMTVSELKRRHQIAIQTEEVGGPSYLPGSFRSDAAERPQFLSEKKLSAVEIGVATHTVMQQLPLDRVLTGEEIAEEVERMVQRELLTPMEAAAIDMTKIEQFFSSEAGHKVREGLCIYREVPFNLLVPAQEVYADWGERDGEDSHTEMVLLQGVIDCLVEKEDGWLLLDYKTDRTVDLPDGLLQARYKEQLDNYARAVTKITGRPVKEKMLYFFDEARTLYL
ncbi:helicase-exonuclease AddAB subunit AddA [Aneurinibacillus aneurinilyticus]|uniref:ATP-dependent helicase/nuclease subunit A n=1 Tax=Aneurinibacillus aneurinilyticus ATCC 12856 TaxID=649747 RepID=U1WYL1_ANEAE|nr:helicase-exonuclease AddAB subunit AddA [Aneurinibacillus aneurinilyticus]ERI07343.1 ATP-dependent nuclease subunit A [Aneurinibacillus aneurinilyticus ATCC 12856]MED0709388.1 helicase-exonuclease AddAB subunit AddA [Aneurinibacillus aneurinilyticus]MED0725994.1 helicase-exonuclease AddAB subunit AddA [Aneurinibacillus aneurinilyticus]MED0733900.1 helicase-exonuclease AddAB subunit AddA [Aneurinibacillus aneurinilyticus]MED0743958.1 helicase-exonuclease AddAB subunit AddA [Aneurinibacillus 